MYTRDDYLKDLYLVEHGRGYEKSMAEVRVRDYQSGRDPELRNTPEGRKIIAQQENEEFNGLMQVLGLFVLSIIIGAIIGSFTDGSYGFAAFIVSFLVITAFWAQ